MKKLTAIILACVLTLTLAACGGGVSQAEYDRLQRALDRLQDELDSLSGGNTPSGGESSFSVSANVGDIIQFGGYDWRVLEVKDGKALILSDKILTIRPYHPSSITWAESELREYLNSAFIEDTFTSEEKTRIAEIRLENQSNQWYGTAGGIQTIDRVFLLSMEEVVKHFGDSGQLRDRPGNANVIDDEYNLARIAYTTDGTASWWWLRSPGCYGTDAASVLHDGRVDVTGLDVRSDDGGVRPALWLNL